MSLFSWYILVSRNGTCSKKYSSQLLVNEQYTLNSQHRVLHNWCPLFASKICTIICHFDLTSRMSRLMILRFRFKNWEMKSSYHWKFITYSRRNFALIRAWYLLEDNINKRFICWVNQSNMSWKLSFMRIQGWLRVELGITQDKRWRRTWQTCSNCSIPYRALFEWRF